MEWGDFRSEEGSFFVVGFVPIEDEIGRERGGGGGARFLLRCCQSGPGRGGRSPRFPPPLPSPPALNIVRSASLPPLSSRVATYRYHDHGSRRVLLAPIWRLCFFVFEKECGMRNQEEARQREDAVG